MSPSNEQVTVRPGVVEDVPFIFNSWLKSFRDAPVVQGIPNVIYYKEHHDVIERILSGAGLQVLVVCNKEHPDQIYSYLVGTLGAAESTIHWVYTKHPFRRMGMADELLKAFTTMVPVGSSMMYSHRTPAVNATIASRNMIYNPYKAK